MAGLASVPLVRLAKCARTQASRTNHPSPVRHAASIVLTTDASIAPAVAVGTCGCVLVSTNVIAPATEHAYRMSGAPICASQSINRMAPTVGNPPLAPSPPAAPAGAAAAAATARPLAASERPQRPTLDTVGGMMRPCSVVELMTERTKARPGPQVRIAESTPKADSSDAR